MNKPKKKKLKNIYIYVTLAFSNFKLSRKKEAKRELSLATREKIF